MRAEDAKNIPIQEVVEAFGGVLQRKGRNGELWYRSPFRNDTTASFKIDTRRNTFIDFGDTRGTGTVIDFWLDFHDKNRKDGAAVSDALKALTQFDRMPRVERNFEKPAVDYSETYKIVSRTHVLKDRFLQIEMRRRGLSKSAFDGIFEQAQILNINSGKKMNAFALDNSKGGTECLAYFPKKDRPFEEPDKWKRCIGPKAPTVFHAHPDCEDITCYAFSSVMDYATYRYKKGAQRPDEECIIYHGDGLINQCAEHINGNARIKKVLHYKHMDEAGEKADNELSLLLENVVYGTRENEYVGFKDLSESMTQKPEQGHNARPVNAGIKPRLKY